MQDESRKLASDYSEQKAELERKMSGVAETAKQDLKRAEADHQRQIRDVEDRFKSSADKEKEDLKQQLSEVQKQLARRHKGGFFRHLGRALDSIFD